MIRSPKTDGLDHADINFGRMNVFRNAAETHPLIVGGQTKYDLRMTGYDEFAYLQLDEDL